MSYWSYSWVRSEAAMVVHGLTTEDIANEKKHAKCPGVGVCDDTVFFNLFRDQRRLFTFECCKRIVDGGRRCFDEFVVSNLTGDEKVPNYLKNFPVQLPLSERIWDKCVLAVESNSFAPFFCFLRKRISCSSKRILSYAMFF